MPPSALLVALSLLAAVAAASATFCSSGNVGSIYGTTVIYQQITIQSSTDITFPNVCPTMQGLFVVACSDVSQQVTVQVFNMNQARVTAPSGTTVHGFAFCEGRPSGGLAAHSENDILPLIGGALPVGGLLRPNVMPLTVGMPGVGALPAAEAVPVERYHQLHWN